MVWYGVAWWDSAKGGHEWHRSKENVIWLLSLGSVNPIPTLVISPWTIYIQSHCAKLLQPQAHLTFEFTSASGLVLSILFMFLTQIENLGNVTFEWDDQLRYLEAICRLHISFIRYELFPIFIREVIEKSI